ncbi:multicopper oxidase family protein [Aurantimonas marianensis]|uniref:Multicopper oxidase family protein n=1 Tax=Aurantimonas marianensis TaxID=2920428 RepID=A0A9X2KFP5_9HYPH|nr:multicopper oxidase family protein [Aurantimonas marianensis]MCP3056708.1 multicopper oxidase family protein [Aurantimonas marianensis]
MISRRRFMLGTAALAGSALTPAAIRAAPAAEPFPELRAAPATAQLLPADTFGPTQVWAYNGATPGAPIRVKAGERVRRRLVNDLPQSTAVHWHGIRIDNAMDGAAGLTQDPVQPGARFDYDFVAPDAGTFWYHSHDRSWEQMARGLSGPLIVEEPEPWLGADRELTLFIDDWRLTGEGMIDEDSLGSLMDWGHGGRIGNVVTVNGTVGPVLPVRAGERIRLRLINGANARILGVSLEGLGPRLIAVDGHPVAPRGLKDDVVVLAPAQRADVVVDCQAEPGARVPVKVYADRSWIDAADLVYDNRAALPTKPSDIKPLAETMRHELDMDKALDVRLDMSGGAMGSMERAMVDGRERGFDELVKLRRIWAFNGVAGDMDEPLFRASVGRTVKLTIFNDTRWPHAMHLHGHHFKVLTRDGKADPDGDWRDTVLNAPMETIEIALEASNPGKWLLHCHMLEHQVAGMKTWFEVA